MRTKPDLGKIFYLPNRGLRAYFGHTVSGNRADYKPPFFEGEERTSVISRWEAILNQANVKSKYPQLFDYEMDMKEKIGPMSYQLPLEERIPSIEEYYSDVNLPAVPVGKSAILQTIKYFSKAGGIRQRSKRLTIEGMRLNTNSGNPYFTKRKRVVNQTLGSKLYFKDGEWYIHTPDGDFMCVAVLGWRGQEGGPKVEDVKQRVIWMMSFLLNLEELTFYQPAIEAIQAAGLIPAFVSMDAVDREVTQLFDTKGAEDLVVVTDFKGFDQHFNKVMQSAAREIEEGLFQHSAPWFKLVYPAKFNVPLVCSEDLIFYGPHGMGSGSGGTNFDECMAHKALQFEVALENGHRLNPHSMAYGDDGILTYPGITVEQVIKAYERHGQVLNPTKQYASHNDCVVLRRWHGTDYRVDGIMVGVYSTMRALGRLLAQERYYSPKVWSKENVTLRALSILENCKWSPYFHEFIDFVMSGDKYRLGTLIPGFYDNLVKHARKSMELITDFLGFTKSQQVSAQDAASGINDWEVVKYIRSTYMK